LRVGREYLNANVVCTGRLVGANPIPDGDQITPGNDGINEPIAPTIFEI
jgi:hypothetical protein